MSITSVCLSVCRSVGLSICRSVGLSVGLSVSVCLCLCLRISIQEVFLFCLVCLAALRGLAASLLAWSGRATAGESALCFSARGHYAQLWPLMFVCLQSASCMFRVGSCRVFGVADFMCVWVGRWGYAGAGVWMRLILPRRLSLIHI